MDCGSTGTAAGIDPKILETWQTDNFPISAYEHPGYEQPQEWDTSQDSSQGDADIVEINGPHGSLSRDQSTVSIIGQPDDYQGSDYRCGYLSCSPLLNPSG